MSRKHCFPKCFLGAQTSGKQCFLAAKTKKHFTGNTRLCMFNLGNTAYTTTESSQHCFLSAQTGKHLLQKLNVSEKVRNIFCFSETKNVSATNVSFALKRGNIEGNMFPQQCFHNNVSPFAAAFKKQYSRFIFGLGPLCQSCSWVPSMSNKRMSKQATRFKCPQIFEHSKKYIN